MKSRLTPYYIDLIYDACLKSYWRKKSLAKFLQHCNVPSELIGSWLPDESKRDLLDRVFPVLLKTDEGKLRIMQIAKSLMEQKSFPDLQNWEDSSEKIKAAHDAVSRLRIHHQKQEEEIQSDESKKEAQKEFRERQEAIALSQQSLQKEADLRICTTG
jgi:hypothetical protein